MRTEEIVVYFREERVPPWTTFRDSKDPIYSLMGVGDVGQGLLFLCADGHSLNQVSWSPFSSSNRLTAVILDKPTVSVTENL